MQGAVQHPGSGGAAGNGSVGSRARALGPGADCGGGRDGGSREHDNASAPPHVPRPYCRDDQS
eukprot:12139764-Alexandrium_andersonii.AAC.1